MKTSRSIVKTTFFNSLGVTVVGNLSIVICSLVDGLIISLFLGSENMAAYGIAAPLLNAFMMLSFFFTAGLKNICSRQIGAGNLKKANDMYSVAMVFLVGVSFLFSILMVLCKGNIAELLGADSRFETLKQLTGDYIIGLAPGITAFCLTFAFSFVLYLDGNGKYASIAVIIQTVVDIVGDLLSVFVFDGGLIGIGLATSISNIVAAVLSYIFIRQHRGGLSFHLKGIRLRDIGPICVGGAPAAAERMYIFVRNVLLNRILLSVVSVEAVSAFAVLNSLSPFYALFTVSAALTVLPMASIFYGEQDKKSLTEILKVSCGLDFIIQICYSAVIILSARYIVGLLCQPGTVVYQIAVSAAILYAVSLPFNAVNLAYQNYLQSVGKVLKTSILSLCGSCLFCIVFAFILGKCFGANGVWIAFAASELFTILLIFIITSVERKRLPFHLNDYLNLPNSFGAADEFVISASTVEEVVSASEKLRCFAASHDASSKDCNLLSLTVEEMGRNIVVWGFNDKKPHILDVRVVYQDEGWIVRIRDDSKIINPNQWVKLHHPEDELANIGFRMICGLSKEVQYTSSLGINNLIIKLQK